jgi:hypothetical protein
LRIRTTTKPYVDLTEAGRVVQTVEIKNIQFHYKNLWEADKKIVGMLLSILRKQKPERGVEPN